MYESTRAAAWSVNIPIVDEATFWSVIDQIDWDKTGTTTRCYVQP